MTTSTFSRYHVARAFRVREERIGARRSPRTVTLAATDEGILWVEHGWLSPANASIPPFVSFAAFRLAKTTAEFDALMRDSRAAFYTSDAAFNPALFRAFGFSFSSVDLSELLSLCELRHAALLAADAVSYNAHSPGLREALRAHAPTDDLPENLPAVLRAVMVASVGYAPNAPARAGDFGAIVNTRNPEASLGVFADRPGVGGADDIDFTRRLINSLPNGTFR
jgi:hypothetical protein